MDKIKNVLNPGAKHDDEVLYGSGQSSDPVHTAVNPAPFSSGTLGHLADDGRTNEPSTAHDLDSTTGATTTMEPTGVTSTRDPTNSDPLSGTGTAAFDNMSGDRRGYEHDVGSTTAIREGVPGAPSGSGLSGSSTNKPLPNEPRSALAGSAYVQSDGSVRSSNINPDRSFPVGGSSNATSEATRVIEAPGSEPVAPGYSPTTSTTTGTASHGRAGRDAAVEGATVGSTGLAEHQGQHMTSPPTAASGISGGSDDVEHAHTGHGHQYTGDPCGPNEKPAGPHFVPGPHITDTANRLDPNASTTGLPQNILASDAELLGSSNPTADLVNRGRGTSATTTNTVPINDSHAGHDAALGDGAATAAYDADRPRDTSSTTTKHAATGQHHSGRDAALMGGVGAATYEVDQHRGSTSSAAGSVYHKSALLNKLDPRVKEDTPRRASAAGIEHEPATGQSGKQYHVADSGMMGGSRVVVPYETPASKQPKNDHEHDVTGSAGAGAATYKADQHRGSTSSTATGVYHKSALLNKLDPRVKEDTPRRASAAGIEHEPATGQSGKQYHVADSGLMGGSRVVVPYEIPADRKASHLGRDGVGGTLIAGAGYEAEKRHDDHKQGHAPAKGVESTGTGFETERVIGGPSSSAGDPYGLKTAGPHSDPVTGATGTTEAKGVESTGTGSETERVIGGPSSSAGDPYGLKTAGPHSDPVTGPTGTTEAKGVESTGTGSETERVIGGPSSSAGDPYGLKIAGPHSDPVTGATGTTSATSTNQTANTTNQHDLDRSVATGAIAGTGGVEYSKNGVEHVAKQQQREAAREEEHHGKAIAKEQKLNEKEITKEHKHDQKTDGKKHGGILGFLHRDKADTAAKEQEAEREESSTFGPGGAKPAVLGASGGLPSGISEHEHEMHEKHERNRLHKDPPAKMISGNTTYADKPTTGYASQVTGGTGTTALAQGTEVPSGSHLTSLGNELDPAVSNRGENVEPNLLDDGSNTAPMDSAINDRREVDRRADRNNAAHVTR